MKKKSIACLLSLVTLVVLVLINGFSSDAASGKWKQTGGRWWLESGSWYPKNQWLKIGRTGSKP